MTPPAGSPGTYGPTPRRHRFRVQAEAYGVHLEVTVDHSGTATAEELGRALSIAAAQALAEHQRDRPC